MNALWSLTKRVCGATLRLIKSFFAEPKKKPRAAEPSHEELESINHSADRNPLR